MKSIKQQGVIIYTLSGLIEELEREIGKKEENKRIQRLNMYDKQHAMYTRKHMDYYLSKH